MEGEVNPRVAGFFVMVLRLAWPRRDVGLDRSAGTGVLETLRSGQGSWWGAEVKAVAAVA